MIVGSGMVAGACKALKGWESDILYASGVSNSSEHRKELFDREIALIESYLSKMDRDSSFVYFSTTSILDPSKAQSSYIKHKLEIEAMLRSDNLNHLIIRLPNLVGRSKNPHTLTNFFAESIQTGRPVKLINSAIRHLIDVSDLAFILNEIKDKFGKTKATVNVETNRPLTARQILSLMEESMQKKVEVIEAVEPLIIQNSIVDEYSGVKYIFETSDNYHRDLIRKYYAS